MAEKTDKRVISGKRMPVRLPIVGCCVWWLMLDRLHAPDWVYGLVGGVAVLVLIGLAVVVWKQVEVDVFKDGE